MFESEIWVALAFITLLLVMWKFGVFNFLIVYLDQYSERIRHEYKEADRVEQESVRALSQAEAVERNTEQSFKELLESKTNLIQQIEKTHQVRLKEMQLHKEDRHRKACSTIDEGIKRSTLRQLILDSTNEVKDRLSGEASHETSANYIKRIFNS